MDPRTLSILRNPYTKERLILENNFLVSEDSNQSFPIRDGIPNFILEKYLNRRSKWFRRFYDAIAFAYDGVVNFGDRLRFNSEGIIRKEYIGNLEIKTGEKVLETAIGTASNLFFLPPDGDYYGVDISAKMLKHAKERLQYRKRTAQLFQADGEYLPFKDNSFDLVFQMGGLQFYSHPYRGLEEMARVAKRGTTVHVLDEKRSIRGVLRRCSACKNQNIKKHSIFDLHQLVPMGMENIQSRILFDSDFYLLTFCKPQNLGIPYNIASQEA
jgi:ubiquinone/menaquinone biosynthesis C-methylase UbiE